MGTYSATINIDEIDIDVEYEVESYPYIAATREEPEEGGIESIYNIMDLDGNCLDDIIDALPSTENEKIISLLESEFVKQVSDIY